VIDHQEIDLQDVSALHVDHHADLLHQEEMTDHQEEIEDLHLQETTEVHPQEEMTEDLHPLMVTTAMEMVVHPQEDLHLLKPIEDHHLQQMIDLPLQRMITEDLHQEAQVHKTETKTTFE